MDLGAVISVAAAAASAIGVTGTIGSSFGRRHRLKLAAEVRDAIGADQLPAWEAMINRDAEAIIALSRRPILPAFVSILGMSGAAFAGFFLHGWRVRIPVMILSWIVAAIAGWMFGWHSFTLRKSKRDEDSRRAAQQARLELKLEKLKTERLRQETDDLRGQVVIMADFRLVQLAWSSSALYLGGAPMADVKRARDPMVGADSYPDPKLVSTSRSWRFRARLRRYSLRRRAYDFTRYKAVRANYEAKYDIAARRRAES